VLPLRPGFFGDFVVNALPEFARIQLKILAVRFTLQEGTKNGSAHNQSSLIAENLYRRSGF
jgi:hypothetical protein